jgi:hypothetical protein
MKRIIATLVPKQYLRAGSSNLLPIRPVHFAPLATSNTTLRTYVSAPIANIRLPQPDNPRPQFEFAAATEMSEAVYDSKTLKESNAKTFKSLGSKLQPQLLDALNDMGYE